jgi:hypothetical protein
LPLFYENMTRAVVVLVTVPEIAADPNVRIVIVAADAVNAATIAVATLEEITLARDSKLVELAELHAIFGKSRMELVDYSLVGLYRTDNDDLRKILKVEKSSLSPTIANLVSAKMMLVDHLEQDGQAVEFLLFFS